MIILILILGAVFGAVHITETDPSIINSPLIIMIVSILNKKPATMTTIQNTMINDEKSRCYMHTLS